MRKGIAIAAVAVLLLILACIPNTAPVVSITAPHDGDTLTRSIITVKAHATDNVAVTKVEFYVDDELKVAQYLRVADTFYGVWDALTAASGSHAIKAKASNALSKTAEASITVVLAGGGPTLHAGAITTDETWHPADNPHIISSNVWPSGNHTLTIEPGCVVQFAPGTELYCGYSGDSGAIVAVGKPDSIIKFTSSVPSPAPGDWKAVGVCGSAISTTRFSYCTFEYGGEVAYGRGEFHVEDVGAKADYCVFQHSADYGIVCDSGGFFAEFANNTVTNNANYAIKLNANHVGSLPAGNAFTGNTKEGIEVEGDEITTSATWPCFGVPYVLAGDVEVADPLGPVLTIDPGNTIKLASGVQLYCGWSHPGGIIAVGTSSAPITFSSAAASPNPGDWKKIAVYTQTVSTTRFAYCTFEYGGEASSDAGEVYLRDNQVVGIDNCTIRYSGDHGVVCNGGAGFSSFTNNTVASSAKYPIDIYPNYVGTIGSGNTLTGNTNDAVCLEGGTVDLSATWAYLGVPYYVNNDVNIGGATGPVVTIAPGTTLKMAANVEFSCGSAEPGAILADGTSGQITFTSAAVPPGPGNWKGVSFYSFATSQCALKNCKVEYAGNGSPGGNILIRDAMPEVTGDSIGYSSTYGIYLDGATYPDPDTLQAHNTFYNNANGDIYHP